MREMLDEKLSRFEELEKQMSDPEVLSDSNKMAAAAREHGSLAKLATKYRRFRTLLDEMEEVREMAAAGDADEREMADEELQSLTQEREQIWEELLDMTIGGDDAITLKVRIEDDLVTISLDSSGESLHKRGHKEAVGKAPMRETLAALLMRSCGYDGTRPLLDPMCGSGTFPIEAAEWAMGLKPGRARSFAFEKLAGFEPDTVAALRESNPRETSVRVFGSDRNAGAIEMSRANAERAGVAEIASFTQAAISDLERPDCAPGLVMINPPYGGRIGNKKLLFGLYGAMGQRLKDHFQGWKVGIVTSDTSLARATGLPGLTNGAPIPHGGLKVRLFQSQL